MGLIETLCLIPLNEGLGSVLPIWVAVFEDTSLVVTEGNEKNLDYINQS